MNNEVNDNDKNLSGFDWGSPEFLKLREVTAAQAREEKLLVRGLKDARESQGLSLEEVAFRMGITVNRLEIIESGNIDPTLGEIGRYATCINYKVSFEIEEI